MSKENPKSESEKDWEDGVELDPKKKLTRSLKICDEYIRKIRAMIKDMSAESLRGVIGDSDSLAVESEELCWLIGQILKQ